MVLNCTIASDNKIHTQAMIDSGGTGLAFVDESFARHHNLTLYPLKEPRAFKVVDGREITSGEITHIAIATFQIGQHQEKLPMFVTKLGHYPIVLGIPWLQLHDPSIRWKTNTVVFDSDYCLHNCNCNHLPIIAKGVSNDSDPPQKSNVALVGATSYLTSLKRARKTQNKDIVFGKLSLYELKKALRIDERLSEEKIKALVPEDYHDLLPLFDKAYADAHLPPRRPYDHKIELNEGFVPPFGPLYSCNREELETLQEWLHENLSKGFIRASSSPAGAPVLFSRKKDGKLRVCVDYRGLNAGTRKNRYPLPLIRETLERLSRAKYFTTLDIRAGFNNLRIAEGEEWKTAFRTRYGLFESLVMPFGLTNAPASFQHFINDVLRPYLDVFCSAYLDDVIIYSKNLSEHKRQVRQVLEALSAAGLYIKPEKCEFHKTSVHYLGMVVSERGIEMDSKKVEAIVEWETPKNITDLRSFLGFSNFYRRFIKGFSNIVAPLVALTRKDTSYRWTNDCENAFRCLKTAFTSAPILQHFDPDREIIVETDASDYVSGGILSQYDNEGRLHPVAFFSKKHSPAECNYEIYDKELMAIIRCFEE